MKYKTLFRVLLKLLGVWLFLTGLTGAIGTCIQLAVYLLEPTGNPRVSYWTWAALIGQLPSMAFGLYLFFAGEWIVSKAIPSNRPYCNECGYDLTKSQADHCPECGTATASSGEGS